MANAYQKPFSIKSEAEGAEKAAVEIDGGPGLLEQIGRERRQRKGDRDQADKR